MEYLNRIELRGIVGSIRTNEFSGRLCAQFSVATNYAYKSHDGMMTIETTWHNVAAFSSSQVQNLENLQKGDRVYVVGRLVNHRYTGADGIERYSYEVKASQVEKVVESAI